ncbi:hypothetical protein [Engelhardtia mirabilis]|uniref:Uncharacterized protein n=1 Tax=Engelhardtia mirabilis TaxID=2528011 RepID=A0A518BRS1_9BACT|nr:hypothetical protein Pla133_47840 [Planctomycetes bacterium Pla133]QDV03989.1 hypothetical protein Pla86_47820 [Planctomycetes bacterium Pla86]
MLPILLCVPLASDCAPPIAPIALVGQPTPDGGSLSIVVDLAVNSSGDWLVVADTTATTNIVDDVVLSPTGVVYTWGQSFAEPPGSTLIAVAQELQLSDDGVVMALLLLDDPAALPSYGGLHVGNTLVLGEAEPLALAPFAPGSTLDAGSDLSLVSAGKFATQGFITQPGMPGTISVLITATVDPKTGALQSLAVPFTEGDTLGGGQVIGFNQYSPVLNEAGQLAFSALIDPPGPPAARSALFIDGQLLLEELTPAPGVGVTLSKLGRFDINASGQWAARIAVASSSDTDGVLLVGGEVLAREGSLLSGNPALPLRTISESPVFLSDVGNVLWAGDLGLPVPSGQRRALFVGDQVLVREGVTVVDGATVTQLDLGSDGFAQSSSGRYVIFEAKLSDGRQGAFLVDREPSLASPVAGVTALFGCNPLASCLAPTGGSLALGASLQLGLAGGQSPSASPFLLLADAPLFTLAPCGLELPGIGELLLSPAPPNPFLILPGNPGADPAPFTLTVPSTPGLAGVPVWTQGLFVDSGPQPLRLSNALELLLVT